MQTLIYMIRHGESTGNKRRHFLGHTDGALTDLGEAQAARTGAYLSKIGVRPDAVYASPLRRAYKTATLAAAPIYTGKVIPREGLSEIFAGEWEDLAFDEIAHRYPEGMAVWRENLGYAHPTGGERVRDLFSRVVAEVLTLAKENAGRTLLIGSHATPIRSVETFARGKTFEGMKDLPWPANASLSAYLCDGERILPLFYSYNAYLSELAARPHLP